MALTSAMEDYLEAILMIKQQHGYVPVSYTHLHDYELIVSCCTYVLHLENGKIQEQYVLDEKGIQRLKTFFMKTR